MGGTYGGYDEPFPRFDDGRLHHCHFRVYALDVPSLDLPGVFRARGRPSGHRGPRGVGTYTLDPSLRWRPGRGAGRRRAALRDSPGDSR
jgi:Phosphatidylethanolamine-binding protein